MKGLFFDDCLRSLSRPDGFRDRRAKRGFFGICDAPSGKGVEAFRKAAEHGVLKVLVEIH